MLARVKPSSRAKRSLRAEAPRGLSSKVATASRESRNEEWKASMSLASWRSESRVGVPPPSAMLCTSRPRSASPARRSRAVNPTR